jgi:hypothetical protein
VELPTAGIHLQTRLSHCDGGGVSSLRPSATDLLARPAALLARGDLEGLDPDPNDDRRPSATSTSSCSPAHAPHRSAQRREGNMLAARADSGRRGRPVHRPEIFGRHTEQRTTSRRGSDPSQTGHIHAVIVSHASSASSCCASSASVPSCGALGRNRDTTHPGSRLSALTTLTAASRCYLLSDSDDQPNISAAASGRYPPRLDAR